MHEQPTTTERETRGADSQQRVVSGRSNTDLCADDARVACPLFQAEYGGSKPTSALQLKISKCNVHLACKLNGMWHSRFPRIEWSNVVRNQDYICFVAECANLYYAVAIWSSPVAANRLKNGSAALELRRMAIADDAPENTVSRMLKIMRLMVAKQMPHIETLLSYQDTDVHKGTIYKASGWKAVACNEGTDWTTCKRKRNAAQSLAAKVRWEYTLRESANAMLTQRIAGLVSGRFQHLCDLAYEEGSDGKVRFNIGVSLDVTRKVPCGAIKLSFSQRTEDDCEFQVEDPAQATLPFAEVARAAQATATPQPEQRPRRQRAAATPQPATAPTP